MVAAPLPDVNNVAVEAASSQDFFWALSQEDVARELKN